MNLVPKRDQVLGRIVITKLKSAIVTPDETRGVTKFMLVDAVGPEAAAAGYKRGDLVLPRAMNNIFLHGGTYHRVICDAKEILTAVEDWDPKDFLVTAEDDAPKSVSAPEPAPATA